MDQSDELSFWLGNAWLRASGDEVQSLVVEDLQQRVAQGATLVEAAEALKEPERQAGDFGMEIAGTLLAPVVVELLKDFWSGYLKKLGEGIGGTLAEATTNQAKAWFISLFHKKEDQSALAELERKIKQLADHNKLTRKEAARLLEALRSPAFVNELSRSK